MSIWKTIIIHVYMVMIFSGYSMAQNSPNMLAYQFNIGECNLPVYFEGNDLSEDNRTRVLNDYHLIHKDLLPDGRYSVGKAQSFQSGDTMLVVTQGVHFSGRKNRPQEYSDLLGLVGQSEDGSEYLVIPKKLSDAYLATFELMEENSDAVEKMNAFVDFMNNLETAEIPRVIDLFYLVGFPEPTQEEIDAADPQDFREAYEIYQNSLGSVLFFKENNEHFSGALTTELIQIEKVNGKRIGEQLIIFDQGRWKLVVVDI